MKKQIYQDTTLFISALANEKLTDIKESRNDKGESVSKVFIVNRLIDKCHKREVK